MTRVIIADDHAVVRQGLRKILAEHNDVSIVAEASSAEEALDLLQRHHADILLLDISMPGKSGLDALQDLKRSSPGLGIIVLSMHPETQFAVRVLRNGGSGYLTKESAPEELVRAVRKVAAGGKYVSSFLAEQLANMSEADIERLPHERLSDREFEVLRLISEGHSLSEIASRLKLSVKTISTYRARILDKLQLGSNAELARYSVEHHLID